MPKVASKYKNMSSGHVKMESQSRRKVILNIAKPVHYVLQYDTTVVKPRFARSVLDFGAQTGRFQQNAYYDSQKKISESNPRFSCSERKPQVRTVDPLQ
jgi:hypothetical protein